MNHKVEKAIEEYSLLDIGDKVVVALSGGADSVALLYLLNSIKEKYNLSLFACHINHMIRGDEADRDEEFVTALCENLGVELFKKSVDVPKLAGDNKLSLELCGRNVRYEFFAELSEELHAKVATAHTASDNVETVLYNIARGTSLSGLCGIKPKRDYIIRPLILCSRKDIETYCEEHSLVYVTDSTNLTDDYTRNNIRHNCVPILQGINPELCNTVSRMCGTLTDLKRFIDEYSEKEIKTCETDHGFDCAKLLKLDSAVLSNAVSIILTKNKAVSDFRHICLVIDAMKSGGCVDLGNNKRAVCKQGFLRIIETDEADFEIDKPFLNSKYAKYISAKELKNIHKNLLNDFISCDIITDSTRIRTRKEGDTFTFFERNVTKSLKKLFNELKIPAENRNKLLVVANGSEVLWVEGIGVSKQGRVNEHSSGAYKITGDKYE